MDSVYYRWRCHYF